MPLIGVARGLLRYRGGMPRHCSPALLAFAGAERARASVLACDAEAAGGYSDSRSGLGRVLCVPASGATVKRSTSRWSVAAGSLKRSTRAECVRPSRHGMAQRCAVGRRGYLTVLHETTTGPILALRVGGCGSRAGARRALRLHACVATLSSRLRVHVMPRRSRFVARCGSLDTYAARYAVGSGR